MRKTGRLGRILAYRADRHKAEKTTSTAVYDGYYYGWVRHRKDKTDWAGISVGDAFKSSLSYYIRMPAQRLFYKWCLDAQRVAMTLAGEMEDAFVRPKVKAQLTPCYTRYPSLLSALSAIGLTCFLEFKKRVSSRALLVALEDYLEDPASKDGVDVNPSMYKNLADLVAEMIQTRLLLEDLACSGRIAVFVELYRQYSAAMLNFRFRDVRSIVEAVVLYGDLLPEWNSIELHPITHAMLSDISAVSTPFFDKLVGIPSDEFISLGCDWVSAVLAKLEPYLPDTDIDLDQEKQSFLHLMQNGEVIQKMGRSPDTSTMDRIPPLNVPTPPALLDGGNEIEQIFKRLAQSLTNPDLESVMPLIESEDIQTVMTFIEALKAAGGQHNPFEDARYDILEAGFAGFEEGPLEGTPADGHEVSVRFGSDRNVSAELVDRPVELSSDVAAIERRKRKAQPITDLLRSLLYPNVGQIPVVERFRTSGSLDPARLAMGEISSAVFKRNRIVEQLDRRGSPVLLIAADGSGSLDDRQMDMLKTMVFAWLEATVTSSIQVLAGLYHSGRISGISGTLVQWIYHPRKTPATTRKEAVRAIPTLPDTGTGVQADVISVSFMLEEAVTLARGRNIYLVLLSDCAWNLCFREIHSSGRREMYSFFEHITDEMGSRLHTTLVALGYEEETGFGQLLDNVIVVPDSELDDTTATATKIGRYVASVMRERHRLSEKL